MRAPDLVRFETRDFVAGSLGQCAPHHSAGKRSLYLVCMPWGLERWPEDSLSDLKTVFRPR